MALVRQDLLRPDRAILPGEEAFRFRHLLIRDAAYEALSKADRAGLHERFARWLEERGTGLVELDELAGYQPRLDLMKAALLAELGCFDQARSLLTETIAQTGERGLGLLVGYAMQIAWRIEMLADDDDAAERAARRGCEQLDRLGEHAYLSTQSCQLADTLYALGRYDESEQWALRGLELGSSDDLATQFLGLSVRSRLLARKGDMTGMVTEVLTEHYRRAHPEALGVPSLCPP